MSRVEKGGDEGKGVVLRLGAGDWSVVVLVAGFVPLGKRREGRWRVSG